MFLGYRILLASKTSIAEATYALCETLSNDFIEKFIRLLRAHQNFTDINAIRIMRETNNDAARNRLCTFLRDIRSIDTESTPQLLATALECTLYATKQKDAKQQVEMVWTGPLITNVSLRRSSAVLLELIQSAQREIIIISYAAFRVPDTLAALQERCRAGVSMHFILESEQDSHGRLSRDASVAFDPLNGNQMAKFYIWPAEKRPPGALLHAKAVIIDGSIALITSANLTENAISSNIEIGLLVRGGDAPARIHEHVKTLISNGEFVER